MINAEMRNYEYCLYGDNDGYGQSTLIKDDDGNPVVQGTIKIAISITNQSIQDNINYKGATYIGLSQDKGVNDKYVIKYRDELLKVLYVNPAGRFTQVFMEKL